MANRDGSQKLNFKFIIPHPFPSSIVIQSFLYKFQTRQKKSPTSSRSTWSQTKIKEKHLPYLNLYNMWNNIVLTSQAKLETQPFTLTNNRLYNSFCGSCFALHLSHGRWFLTWKCCWPMSSCLWHNGTTFLDNKLFTMFSRTWFT